MLIMNKYYDKETDCNFRLVIERKKTFKNDMDCSIDHSATNYSY